jgi:hypothetical protein
MPILSPYLSTLIDEYTFLPADVWGTVADWALLGATLITIKYVYQTLQAQLRVTEIEQARYRADNIPLFEARITEPAELIGIQHEKYPFQVTACISLVLTNVDFAKNVRLAFPDGPKYRSSYVDKSVGITYFKDTGKTFWIEIRYTPLNLPQGLVTFETFSFTVTFENAIGDKYEQTVKYSFYNPREDISITYPELLPIK